MQLHAQEQPNIFYTFVCKNVSSCPLKFPEKYADKYVENLKQASGEISAEVRPQILCCVALVHNSYHCFFVFLFFFRTCVLRKLFEKLDSHTNTHAPAYSSR